MREKSEKGRGREKEKRVKLIDHAYDIVFFCRKILSPPHQLVMEKLKKI